MFLEDVLRGRTYKGNGAGGRESTAMSVCTTRGALDQVKHQKGTETFARQEATHLSNTLTNLTHKSDRNSVT